MILLFSYYQHKDYKTVFKQAEEFKVKNIIITDIKIFKLAKRTNKIKIKDL